MILWLTLNTALAAEGLGSPACDAAIEAAHTGKAVEAAALRSLDSACLRVVRNSVYARYGMKMHEDDLRQFFSTQSWYTASPSYNEGLLQPIDHSNLDRMQEAEYDARVADAVATGALSDVGPGCKPPPVGPYTAICLDGSRGQFQLNSATPSATDAAYYNYDISLVNGPPSADATLPGCVAVAGHLGVRQATVKPDPAFQKTMASLCVALQSEISQTPGAKLDSCTGLAGDLDGDGVPEGIVAATVSSRLVYQETRLYTSAGGQPQQVAGICSYGQ